MSSSLENCDVRSISIGSKISLLFKESAILEGQSDLIGIVETVKNQGDKNSDFPEIWDLLDKIWIQIGENKRIYGDTKRSNDSVKEEIFFRLSKQLSLIHISEPTRPY